MIQTFWTSKSTRDNKLKFIIIVIGVYLNTPLVLCRSSSVVYYMDHEISEKNAKLAYKDLKYKLLSNATKPPWCKECTAEDAAYCLGNKMLHDHCCCDQKHGEDRLSWVPHTCYISHDECSPYVGSCMTYLETARCCCEEILANDLYSNGGSSLMSTSMSEYYYFSILAPLIYHQIKL